MCIIIHFFINNKFVNSCLGLQDGHMDHTSSLHPILDPHSWFTFVDSDCYGFVIMSPSGAKAEQQQNISKTPSPSVYSEITQRLLEGHSIST